MALVWIVFWLSLSTWLGAVVFFSFIVAPGIFRALPVEHAGEVIATLFPGYYGLGTAAGAVAVAAAMILWRSSGLSAVSTATVVMLVLMLAANLFASRVLHPRAQQLRVTLHESAAPAGPETRAEFDRLHRRAVHLNGAVLLLGLLTVGVTAGRSWPRPR